MNREILMYICVAAVGMEWSTEAHDDDDGDLRLTSDKILNASL